LKKFGLGLGILLILIIGAILIVPGFLNWNKYKDQIEKTASEYTGRRVKIKGDISFSLLPTSALSVNDVSITNLDGGNASVMVSLKSLDVKVGFLSVLSSFFGSKVKVEKFVLIDPIMALEILADGRVNWDILSANPAGGPLSADISLDKFQIVNGQVSFEDMGNQKMEMVRKINVNVKAQSINGPFDVSGTAKYQGLDSEFTVSLGKDRKGKKSPVTLDMILLDGRVEARATGGLILSGKDSLFAGKITMNARDAGDIVTALDLFKGRKSPRNIIVGQNFSFDTALEATQDKFTAQDVNIQMGQSRGQGHADMSFGQDLEKNLGQALDIQGMLTINKLDMDPLLIAYQNYKDNLGKPPLGSDSSQGKEDNSLSRLSGKFDVRLGALKYNDKIASQLNMVLLAKDGTIDISTIQARMPGGSAVRFKGQAAAPQEGQTRALIGDLTLNASNLRGLLSWLKVDMTDIPSGLFAQFSYKSGVKLTSDLLQLYEIDGSLDALSFKGGLSAALQDRPSYGIGLDLQGLNLDSYLPKKAPKPVQTGGMEKALMILDDFDANYNISFSNFTLNGIKIKSGHLNGLLLGGQLGLKEIKLDDAAGINLVASGTGKNFGTKPEFTAKLSAQANSLSPLQRSLSHDNKFDFRRLGKVTLAGSFSSNLEKMDFVMTSKVGGTNLKMKGILQSINQKQFPDIGSADVDIDARSESLAALIDQFDLSLPAPRPADDRPVAAVGRLKVSTDLLDMDGKINIAGGEMMIKGHQTGKGEAATLNLALDLKGAETREFIRGLGLDFQPSSQKLGPIMLKTTVLGTGDRYRFNDISGHVGTVKIGGSGALDLAPETPTFDFELNAGEIPLQDFLRKKRETPKEAKYGQWAKTPLDLSPLSSYQGRAHISATSLRYNEYVFETPEFDTILKDGRLSVHNFTGRLFGGDVTLEGSLGGKDKPNMDVDITLKKASLSQATKSSTGIAPISGNFDLSGHFSGTGASQFDMMSSLEGSGKILAGAGLINGIDIPALSSKLDDMNDKNAFLRLLNAALSGGHTSYKGGVSTIVAKNGKIHFSPFDVELDGATSMVNMDVSLVDWTILTQGNLSFIDHPNAPPIDVTVSGDLSNPHVAYKTDRLKKYVGAKIASNLLQQFIGKEGGLQDIFGDQKKNPAVADPKPAVINPKGEPAEVSPATNQAPKIDQAPKTEEKAPVKVDPAEEFGKRLLEKLLKKDPEKKGDGTF